MKISAGNYIKPILGLVGLGLIFLWTGGAFHSKIAAGRVPFEPGIKVSVNAETFKAVGRELSTPIDLVGTVSSEEKVNLSARISAYINAVFVSAGDKVKKGDILITLDDREIKEKMAAAKARLKQAKTEYNRTKKLFAKSATTDQALIAAESMYHSARAGMEQIKVMLTYTKIRSPLNGVVTDRRIEKGDLANPGRLLLSVYDPKRMRLQVPVPVRLIDKLSLGQKVEIRLDRPEKPFSGRVTEIVSEIDPLSRTQEVKIHINDPEGIVLPGTFGRVWVTEDSHSGIIVPKSSVYQLGQLEMIQVVKGGRVMKRMVKKGSVYGHMVEILSGLKKGETIMVTPLKEE